MRLPCTTRFSWIQMGDDQNDSKKCNFGKNRYLVRYTTHPLRLFYPLTAAVGPARVLACRDCARRRIPPRDVGWRRVYAPNDCIDRARERDRTATDRRDGDRRSGDAVDLLLHEMGTHEHVRDMSIPKSWRTTTPLLPILVCCSICPV